MATRGVNPQLLALGAKSLGNLFKDWLNQPNSFNPTWTNSSMPSTRNESSQGSSKKGRRQKRNSKRGSRAAQIQGAVPRPLRQDTARSVVMTFKEIVPHSTDTNGKVASALTLGVSTTGTLWSLSTVIPRLLTFGRVYRQFKFTRVVFRWIPVASTASAGVMAMGVDQLVTAQIPTAHADVYRHVPSTLCDIKAESTIVWNCKQAMNNDLKYTITQTALDEDSVSFGVFQLYGTGPASTQIGILEVICEVMYTGPC